MTQKHATYREMTRKPTVRTGDVFEMLGTGACYEVIEKIGNQNFNAMLVNKVPGCDHRVQLKEFGGFNDGTGKQFVFAFSVSPSVIGISDEEIHLYRHRRTIVQ